MSDRFAYRKSWGAELVDGGARFRIWAPSQPRMSLRVASLNADLPMREADEGWFEVETDALRPGDLYAFVLADGAVVNDPAARSQPGDIHGPSQLIDPRAYEWRSADWGGRPWEETVFYELHAGAFSPEGTFDGVRRRLDHLVDIGVTALEIMPVAAFEGGRGWGYDGVLLYAPYSAYGGPEGLKRLIDEAHQRGLMMFLDVIYNHFGPAGNYLSLYAPDFFHPERRTPWGSAIAYEKRPVRDYFVENALYWLEEYRFDGLRLDAVDHIDAQSEEPLLEEIAEAVRSRITGRHVHLTTEDDRNITRLHKRGPDGKPLLYSAEWNDDVHHAFHVIATRERDGYYSEFSDDPIGQLARALATGFVYQGEPSPFRDGKPRGEPSAHLPPAAFVNFLQNHDQIGNRAFNERLTTLANPATLELLTAILLLSPQIPLIFMGEEWGAITPFRFFTDFHGELGTAVREGRRREFAKWTIFASEEHRELIADPNADETFADSKLNWGELDKPHHRERLNFVRRLLALRQDEIVPLIAAMQGNAGSPEHLGDNAFAVTWRAEHGRTLSLFANLGEAATPLREKPSGRVIFAMGEGAEDRIARGELPARSVVVTVAASDRAPPQ